ncbi:FmdB family zinc ribbon protein [Dehalococcoides mccartyi]|jgi:putative FmdB family regulatory protein|uniref:FmdB family zinc ribbon protein n=1 Tax=Dehalococcoides mccartyi TaxID=61435 RepID=UPI00006B723A|nr:zinc ribbon domain-containing protein [Dehalococcoides mccartyi]AQX75250.1 FmdB family transcriptional regulator [Dehalococcoides mccartyi]AQY73826.1 FmdB family transcriptional regulator [Dehalococcoides mccartyi]MBA2084347.1 hypothetical protein [Dehalococcoides mccartyi]BCT56571.1 hypothetical protein DHCNIT_00013340 [Dehalococcoides mccartyi]
MALYEFSCTKCKYVFEVNLKVDDRDTPQTCPKCGTTECKRSFGSPVTTQFSGVFSSTQARGKNKTPEKKVIHLSNLNKPR